MKLPEAHLLIVERSKVCEYLLNSTHRYGASKSRFLAEFGFRSENWEELALALRIHGQAHNVARQKQTPFGPRFEVEGELTTPDGRRPRICTIWQLDAGKIAPRLITAYPLPRAV